MLKTLVIYENASDEYLAKHIAMILGPAQILNINDFKEIHKNYELYIIVADEKQKIKVFINSNLSWIKAKKIAVYLSEDKKEYSKTFFGDVKKILKDSFIDLNNEHCTNLKDNKVNNAINFAVAVKKYRDALLSIMPREELKSTIEDFLLSHNTCTLSTGIKDCVRGTPIEYNYKNGCVYFITEGGMKFANLLLNNNVSISIYDSYSGMGKLSGMQLSGKAYILETGSLEYKRVFELKNIPYEQILKLPIIMNVIKVKIDMVEFLCSRFKKMGYDSKQVYYLYRIH